MFDLRGNRPLSLAAGGVSKLRWGVFLGLAVILALLAILGVWLPRAEKAAYFVSAPVPVSADNKGGGAGNGDYNDESIIGDNSGKNGAVQFEVEILKQDVSGRDYFVNYRLKRDQYRQETKAMLSQLLNSPVEKSREQAQEKWLELSAKILQEEEIENLLKIKGFSDVVADVLAENVTVIVYASALTPQEVKAVQDVVLQAANVRADKVTVSYRR